MKSFLNPPLVHFKIVILGALFLFLYANHSHAQLWLDPEMRKLMGPNNQPHLKIYEEALHYKSSNDQPVRFKTFFYYNPDSSLAKRDILLNDKQYRTHIFLYRGGFIEKIWQYDYQMSSSDRITERYSYNQSKLPNYIEKFRGRGLHIDQRTYPLMMLNTRFQYDAMRRLTLVQTRKLTENEVFLQLDNAGDILPSDVNNLEVPMPGLVNKILINQIDYKYNGNAKEASVVQYSGGFYNNLSVNSISNFSKSDDGFIVESQQYPGLNMKKTIKRKFFGDKLSHEIIHFYEQDQLAFKSEKKFDTRSQGLIFWQEEQYPLDQEPITSKWQFSLSSNGSGQVPKFAKRVTQDKIDREIVFSYDQWGLLDGKIIRAVDENGKKRALLDYSCKYNINYNAR